MNICQFFIISSGNGLGNNYLKQCKFIVSWALWGPTVLKFAPKHTSKHFLLKRNGFNDPIYKMSAVWSRNHFIQVTLSFRVHVVQGYSVAWTSEHFTIVFLHYYLDGLVQDCSISSANALEILQSCTKPLTCWNPVVVLPQTHYPANMNSNTIE